MNISLSSPKDGRSTWFLWEFARSACNAKAARCRLVLVVWMLPRRNYIHLSSLVWYGSALAAIIRFIYKSPRGRSCSQGATTIKNPFFKSKMQELLPLAVSSPSVAVSVLALLVSVAYLLHKASLLSQNSDTQLLSRKKGSGKDEARPSAAAKTIQSTVSKESDFPGNWWTGKDIFDLERRAIFSKVCYNAQP